MEGERRSAMLISKLCSLTSSWLACIGSEAWVSLAASFAFAALAREGSAFRHGISLEGSCIQHK